MANYQWNGLTDEKKFEDLINDLCSAKYGFEFQIYGRKGQKQYGIDGFALTQDNKHILYQCKNKDTSRASTTIQVELLKDLETETSAMIKEFIDKKVYIIDRFIFANSFKRDTKLQDKATELSLTHGIDIIIWSWDEVSNMLEEYSHIAQKYYPEFFEIKQKKQQKKISANLNQSNRWNRWENWDRGQIDLNDKIIEKYSYGEYGFHQFKELDDITSIMVDLKNHYDKSTEIIEKNEPNNDRLLHSLCWTRGSFNNHIRGDIKKISNCDRCWVLGYFEMKIKSMVIFDNRTSARANFLIIETDSLENTRVYADEYYVKNYIEELGLYKNRYIKLNEYDCGWANIDGKRVNVQGKAEKRAKILKPTLFFIAPQGSFIHDIVNEKTIDNIIELYEKQNTFDDNIWSILKELK